MKCLIIAAGQGTRLRSVAPTTPLAALAGAPLIEHIVRAARAGGAESFVVVTGYEPAALDTRLRALSASSGIPIEIVHNQAWAEPNGVSVLSAARALPGEFVLLMSDHLFDPAILRGLIASRRTDAALTLGVDFRVDRPDLDLDDATQVRLGAERRIVRIGKTIGDYDAVDTGIFLAGPSLFQALEMSLGEGGSGSLSEGVQRLADGGSAFVHDIGDGWWVDVDDEPAFRRAERELPARLPFLS